MYADYKSYNKPKNENIKIWRYMSFSKFASILQKKSLYFSSIAKLEDPFEGRFGIIDLQSLSKRIGESQDMSKESTEDFINKLLDFQDYIRLFVFVNCWHINNEQSDAMWKIYSQNNEGIAIQSTFKRLCDSFNDAEEMINVGEVIYFNDRVPEALSSSSLYMYKRTCFQHEKELRAVYSPVSLHGELHLLNSKVENGKYIPVNLDTLIENIYISPLAENWFRDTCKSLLKSYNVQIEPIQSELYSYTK